MKELDRTNVWSRKVIGVFTTTGTGWVDERAASPLEYMNDGDTALVGLQYSYLPSWISFLVDTDKAADAGREMINAVADRLATMPKATRPKLLLFGESLGSFGTESAFDNIDQMLSKVDGALLAGPVFRNDIHNTVTADRDPGSPFWRPVYKDGEHVRFAVDPADLAQPATDWKFPRIVYLQNATDPITYWKFDLLWQHPEWLNQPRGPDVSSHMFWIPVVTFWQTAADMAFSTGVPRGPRPRLRREPGERVGRDRPAARMDRREDRRAAPDPEGQVVTAARAPRRRRRSCSTRCGRTPARSGCPTAGAATRTARRQGS